MDSSGSSGAAYTLGEDQIFEEDSSGSNNPFIYNKPVYEFTVETVEPSIILPVSKQRIKQIGGLACPLCPVFTQVRWTLFALPKTFMIYV